MALKDQPIAIDQKFFQYRAQVAFQITYEGRKDKQAEYDRMQEVFWSIVEKDNAIWGKLHDNL